MENIPELKSPTHSSALVAANYNKLSDHIRRLTPEGIQCSVFCGGANCKYENPDNWTADCLAVQGIYSHWITDNILAMARPSTAIITKKNIIQQFESLGIKSVINLQSPKEHASCGQPLENSGFSYDPNIFMENKIYYYNFAWKDYGDATTIGLLNMVKVLAFALTEGRVAVHCHAGLGRTGVLIACYLIYALRAEANDVIRYVRYKRPGSVQTRGQIMCVRHFARFVLPQQCTFYIKECEKEKYMAPFSLHRFVRRQKVILHGYEERMYKYFPKIVHILCERILKLSGCWTNEYPENSNTPITKEFLCSQSGSGILRHESIYSISSNISYSSRIDLDQQYSPTGDELNTLSVTSAPPSPSPSECSDSFSELYDAEINEELLLENKCFQELETQRCFSCEDDGIKVFDISVVINALLVDISSMDSEMKAYARKLQMDINNSQVGWARINVENNIVVLAAILFDWIESLKEPVLTMDNMENIVIYYKQPEHCLSKFDIKSGYLIEYLLHFLSKIQPISKEVQTDIIRRFLAALAHQCVVINKVVLPSSKGFCKLREGTLTCAMEFLESLYMVLEVHHQDVVRDEFMESHNQLFDCKSEAEPNCFQ